MPDMHDVLAVILGGGRGSRLYPLTKDRAKPAVPIAGKYRLIDIPISNCINSDINNIAVLTQFKSVSLHRHISQTYIFDAFSRGWVQIWAAEQRGKTEDWYQGTADAVRKQILEIESARTAHTLVLAGDHLYRMDYEELAKFHWENDADITVAVQPVRVEDASRFGLLKTADNGLITDFAEKPKDADLLAKFVSRDDAARPYLGSMGIYLFKTQALLDLLRENQEDTDFGGEIIPGALKSHLVYGYEFDGYWEDIGTIRSFYDTNLSLAQHDPDFSFHDAHAPIYSRSRFLPGSFVSNSKLEDVFLTEGCYIHDAIVERSVIGVRSQIMAGSKVKDSVLMGADYYDNPDDLAKGGGVPLGIGQNCHIQGAIIDKNARIGDNVIIKPYPRGTEIEVSNCFVRDGIVVVPKRAILKAGTKIGP